MKTQVQQVGLDGDVSNLCACKALSVVTALLNMCNNLPRA